ncbi:LOW QUALITY PROTEIN: peptidylprolyl isomerase domain and WD repeat-containing protein 1-like [Manduca sexta]|uniref:LOW QUALITY PROTEIN: peptidylprolyl isomerase domain and WD repeat-containing protein 1-like n=1 Tax=Manduca sexta TaxID=7130 RepID=UPI00188E5EE4|nr:LOW QUALITY PROTEIN: peptidylprolyl isomerase domain and WD repeat-containing protein 1-like [Manduca sexta]
MTSEKRPGSEDTPGDAEEPENWIGPMPSEATKPKPKKRKVLEFESLYIENLPSSETYEHSYMHRDVVTHVVVTKTDFIITVSQDGHLKFWKKQDEGIEFVKHFRCHLAPIADVAANSTGSLLCTISSEKTVKVFDVVNFDMINMMTIEFEPYRVEWVHSAGDPISALAISDKNSNKIHIFDGTQALGTPLHTFETLHQKPVVTMKYNPVFEAAVSVDKAGIVEYWTGPKHEYCFPKNVRFESKLDTDLFDFVKNKTYPTGLAFSPDGKKMASISLDRKVRVFHFATGKLHKVLDESLQRFQELQHQTQQLPNMEFGRRMAAERDLEKSDSVHLANVLFDASGHFVVYATMLGVKIVNLTTNRCVAMLGKPENLRPLHLALFQGRPNQPKVATTLEMEGSENPTLLNIKIDPTLLCTAYKKNRFYLFTQRSPDDIKSPDADRDIFNEKPSKEDIISATEGQGVQRIYEQAIIHTSVGDVHVRLFGKDVPRSAENFSVHARNGYYNGHIFHRVIKGFMVQTGDPTGTGTGGESIWGGEFADEFRPQLKHDRPYTLSMANAGPNTNGSQFFITLAPTPWLDNKHTVFGRVVRGMEVVQNIGSVKTNPKTDKPYEDIRIISITVK